MSYTIDRYGEEIDHLLDLAETSVQPDDLTEACQQTQTASVQAAGQHTDGLVGVLANLYTTHKTNLVAAINELFQSASDGKSRIAAAITGMGIAAAASETWAALATKISQIRSGWLQPLVANGTSITPTGTYASATYYDTTYGVKVGYMADGNILLSMKGGTSAAYEYIYFALGTVPSGVTIEETHNTSSSYAAAMPALIYACVISGVTKSVNISVNMSAVDATGDYVRATIDITEV